MKNTYILSIESSCDETSMAIVKNGKEVISIVINTQISTHENYGGVVPEIASRMHAENITIVLDETLKKANMKIIGGIMRKRLILTGLMSLLIVSLTEKN